MDATKNITLKIDAETYDRARIVAAQKKTSLSALVREYLARLVRDSAAETEEERLEKRRQALEKLWEMADARDRKKSGSVGPIRREDAYEDRIR